MYKRFFVVLFIIIAAVLISATSYTVGRIGMQDVEPVQVSLAAREKAPIPEPVRVEVPVEVPVYIEVPVPVPAPTTTTTLPPPPRPATRIMAAPEATSVLEPGIYRFTTKPEGVEYAPCWETERCPGPHHTIRPAIIWASSERTKHRCVTVPKGCQENLPGDTVLEIRVDGPVIAVSDAVAERIGDL